MQNVDFLPERIVIQRARKQRLIRHSYLVAVCVVGLALLGYWRHDRLQEARGELAATSQRSREVQTRLQILDSLEQQQAELMIKKRISDHLGSRVNALDVMAELEHLLPTSMALTSLNLETMEVRVPVARGRGGHTSSSLRVSPAGVQPRNEEKAVYRVRLVLTGLAPTDVDVANFIGQLSASKLFEDVTMGYAKNVSFRKRSAREFRASCYVTR
jgi:Tfp pilus assembly protein PilN